MARCAGLLLWIPPLATDFSTILTGILTIIHMLVPWTLWPPTLSTCSSLPLLFMWSCGFQCVNDTLSRQHLGNTAHAVKTLELQVRG